MNKKKKTLVGLMILLLFVIPFLINYGMNNMRSQNAINDFSKIVESGAISDLSLTIYYESPNVFTLYAWGIDDLIRASKEKKIVIGGSALEEHIDLFRQVSGDGLAPVKKKSSFLDARLYYVFETKEKDKVFDVAMWGDKGGIFINGVEFQGADVFYDIVMPFLPEDAAELWKEIQAVRCG